MINLSVYNGTTRTVSYTAKRLDGLRYSQMYPGGLYATASFFIPGSVTRYQDIQGGYRLVMRDGLAIVWLGEITGMQPTSSMEREGWQIEATGYWGSYLNKALTNKPWCDNRIDNNTWYEHSAAWSSNDKTLLQNMSIDRINRIRFTPDDVLWSTNQFHRVRYSAPTGDTVKRVTFEYDLQETPQQWSLLLYSETGGGVEWQGTATGIGTVDQTLGTASQHIFFYMRSDAVQTPASAGTIYAEVSNVKVYTETGNINLTEIAKDIRARSTSLDTSENRIGSNTLSLEPFITNGYETRASILTRAASYGDSAGNSWACWLGDSETLAGATFPAPILCVEQQPSLTSADYYLSVDDIPDFVANIDYDNLYNWIAVSYTDLTGKTIYITPDDDSSLSDSASIATHRTRQYPLSIQTESSTSALNYGKRFLAAHKDPKITISSPINVPFVLGSGGNRIPAARVRAGKTLKITNYLHDITGAGMTFLITGTEYTGDDDMVSITTGQPDPLSVIVARQAAGMKW